MGAEVGWAFEEVGLGEGNKVRGNSFIFPRTLFFFFYGLIVDSFFL